MVRRFGHDLFLPHSFWFVSQLTIRCCRLRYRTSRKITYKPGVGIRRLWNEEEKKEEHKIRTSALRRCTRFLKYDRFWLRCLGKEIDRFSVDNCCLLNTEQKLNTCYWRNRFRWSRHFAFGSLKYAYHYFPEDTSYVVLFIKVISISDRNLIRIVTAVLTISPFCVWGSSEVLIHTWRIRHAATYDKCRIWIKSV